MKTITALILILAFMTGCGSKLDQRPVIGITSSYKNSAHSVSNSYVEAIKENGGIPVILPAVKDKQTIDAYVHMLDGLVLIGGEDIPPSAYNQTLHPTTKVIDETRYNFERQLIEEWLAGDKPVLGICLGMQFVNVVSGGNLIQDIPSQTKSTFDHRCKDKLHSVAIDPSSRLAKALNATRADVYSNHHQAVDVIGKNLRAVAHSDDGLVEALEKTNGNFGLFVQWHPEVMSDSHRDAIFSALINAAAKAK